MTHCQPECPDDVPSSSDDPESVTQWHLPALGVPDAWRVQRGSPDTIVAVVDNGFDLTHPDLVDQLWSNPLELLNGVDDDGNGFIDDIHGWNFLDGNAELAPITSDAVDPDTRGHGTAVAGIIAAQADNGAGVAGCCPGCTLMLLRARDFDTENTVVPRLAEAIDYAVDRGASVINISDGVLPADLDPDVAMALETALEEAEVAGVVVVASAGNDAADSVRVPARYDSVLAVAAVDHRLRPAPWTSFGSEVDVSAPGTCIYTTEPDGDYRYFEGTSAAAPIAAGLAGLLLSAHPDWSAQQVRDAITENVEPVEPGGLVDAEGKMGSGVLNFENALEAS
jgi:subtilisin family serine protease